MMKCWKIGRKTTPLSSFNPLWTPHFPKTFLAYRKICFSSCLDTIRITFHQKCIFELKKINLFFILLQMSPFLQPIMYLGMDIKAQFIKEK